jgi:hypothetical protein
MGVSYVYIELVFTFYNDAPTELFCTRTNNISIIMLLTEQFLASEKRHYGRLLIVECFMSSVGSEIILFY